MKSILYLILLFTVPGILVYSQNFPDYPERSILTAKDSLLLNPIISQATEGSINPDEYQMGPGDKIFISISGIEETIHTLQINHEGGIYIPKVGVVDLSNTSLSQARKLIEQRILKYFKDIDLNIFLLEFRKIKVTLTGEVQKPGIFIFPANARLLDLISSSLGLKESANFRNITIKSKNGTNKEVDMLSFLRNGDILNNPLLYEGDIVIVQKIDETIFVGGEVFYPGFYEFKDGEYLNELIALTGGLLDKARRDSIEIVRFYNNGRSQQSLYYSYDEILRDRIPLEKYDNVLVRKIPRIYENRFVQVTGKIKYPGYYKIKMDTTTLLDIIYEAGGIREDASLTEATLYRVNTEEVTEDPEFERLKLIPVPDMTEDEYDYFKAKSRQKAGHVVINFTKLLKEGDLSENIILKKDDIIYFPEAKNYVTLLGQVVNPGNLIYEEDLKVEDYIQLAGGFAWRALEGDVRVIKAKSGEWVDADDVEQLGPGDTIWIPEDPPGPKFWDVFTTSLSVIGQVAAVVAATVAVIVATR